MDNNRTVERNERFSGLVERSVDLGDGIHEVRVKKVLDIGTFRLCQPDVAIIEDDQKRILLIPEDTKCDGHNRLTSRWNVKNDMLLRLTVKEGKISNVLIGD